MPGTLSSTWLLRTSDPVYLRTEQETDGVLPQRLLSCSDAGPHEWLIVANPESVLFVCRCGRRQQFAGTLLKDVIALVEAEAVQQDWTDLDDALRALGFPTDEPPSRPIRRRARKSHSPRKPSSS